MTSVSHMARRGIDAVFHFAALSTVTVMHYLFNESVNASIGKTACPEPSEIREAAELSA
jgi:FlaA1/EpsC-like NDP-sugar epimerase